MTEKQKNKIRIKYLKEGIELLEEGIDPILIINNDHKGFPWKAYQEKMYLSELGAHILFYNHQSTTNGGIPVNITKHGFIDASCFDKTAMLHNWKRFYELIKDLK